MSKLNLSGLLMHSTVNGPGTRAVIWVQGCPLRCRGCFNKASWSFSPNNIIPADELASRILAAEGIEGVTFSGGEPFAQAAPLAEVAERIQDAGLSVVAYSGYTFRHLTMRNDPDWDRLLTATDLLIAGPYLQERACGDPYRGSANQQVIPLSGRIVPKPALSLEREEETVEFTIAADGTITTTGFPTDSLVQHLAARCRG